MYTTTEKDGVKRGLDAMGMSHEIWMNVDGMKKRMNSSLKT